jgi:hypothetical protein
MTAQPGVAEELDTRFLTARRCGTT